MIGTKLLLCDDGDRKNSVLASMESAAETEHTVNFLTVCKNILLKFLELKFLVIIVLFRFYYLTHFALRKSYSNN